MTAHRLLLRGDGVVRLLMVLIGDWIFKSMVRLGLRGRGAPPPPPPPPPGRGGEARACRRAICAIFTWGDRARLLTVLLPSPRVGERGRG
jgi:hypothetical protein